jgi:hypothetical protein
MTKIVNIKYFSSIPLPCSLIPCSPLHAHELASLGLYSPPSCASHAPLYVIVVEEELCAFLLNLLVLHHHTSIYRGGHASVALKNLRYALLHGSSLLGKASLNEVFGSLVMCHSDSSQAISWMAVT